MLAITPLIIQKNPGENTRCDYGVTIENHSTERVTITSTDPESPYRLPTIPPGDRGKVVLGLIYLKQNITLVERQITLRYEWASPFGTQEGETTVHIVIPEPSS